MNQTEAARLAAIVWNVRPEWPQASLQTFIVKNLLDKPYQLATIACIACYIDPDTKTPARVLEAGPWWKAAQAALGQVASTPMPDTIKSLTCNRCGHLKTEGDDEHRQHCQRTTDPHEGRELARQAMQATIHREDADE